MNKPPATCQTCESRLTSDDSKSCAACQMKLGLLGDQPTMSAPFVPLKPEQLNEKFADLDVLELVGAGGMGAVYKAHQKKLDRIVALKVVHQEISETEEFAQRFEREAKALARLNSGNIVGIYDYGDVDGLFYYLMEYVEGANLAELAAAEKLSPSDSLEIVTQICRAIQFAHEHGVVHRDIKPTNILINDEGVVKIADFGLAKLCSVNDLSDHLTQTKHVLGTPRYMAPEQIESTKDVDHRADIYSLGVIFYELLTGELPLGRFDAPSQKVEVDVRLDEIVLRALAKHPERRYQAARHLHSDLSTYALNDPKPPVKNQVQSSEASAGMGEASLRWHIPASMVLGVILFLFGFTMCLMTISMHVIRTRWNPNDPPALLFAAVTAFGAALIFVAFRFLKKARPVNSSQQVLGGSPVRKVFNYRFFCYLSGIAVLVAVNLPWLNNEFIAILGIEVWRGAASVALCIVFLAALTFIDIYEGQSYYYAICLILFSLCLIITCYYDRPFNGIIREQLIIHRLGFLNSGWNVSLFGRRIMAAACFSLAFLGVYGLGRNLFLKKMRKFN